MKKLIALAIVAVMLVAMAANVLATETVYATAVLVENTNIGDGTISAGEYGDPVAYITSEFAYDDDSEDEMTDENGKLCQSYVRYQGVDPFAMNAYIYIAWAYDTCDRIYFAVDMANIDGKFVALSTDDWDCESIQWRMGNTEASDDPAASFDTLWGDETFNNIFTAMTGELEGAYAADGAVFGNDKIQVLDHSQSGNPRLNSAEVGALAGSIGVKADRVHFESILLNKYWLTNPTIKAGDSFACSLVIFNTSEGNDKWEGFLTWGHGITGYNTGVAKTGTNKVILAAPSTDPTPDTTPVTEAPVTEAPVTEAPVTEAPVTEAPVTEAPVTEAPATQAPATQPTDPAGPTGDALVVVIATAIMALGTAVIVKKVK